MIRTSLLALAISGLATAPHAHPSTPTGEAHPDITANVILRDSEDVIGQQIVYPDGEAEITVEVITVEPGAQTGWHIHGVPMFAYFQSGSLTIDYGSEGLRTYNPGDVMLEAVNWPHTGSNNGDVPAVVMVVYIGSTGATLAATAEEQ